LKNIEGFSRDPRKQFEITDVRVTGSQLLMKHACSQECAFSKCSDLKQPTYQSGDETWWRHSVPLE